MSVVTLSPWVPQDFLHANLNRLNPSHVAPSQEQDASTPSETGTPSSSPSPPPDAEHAHHHHDPHHLPEFDSAALEGRSSPILYLPPLLSSLPPGYTLPAEPTGSYRPLKTETHLPDIDPASLHLHKALHHFQPVTAEYAETPYEHAFNWDELRLPEDAEREWYAVVFQSRRKEGSDGGPLYEADRLAHEEAVRNGGLILYWYGIPHPETGLNLATCIWQSRAHAIAANSRPHHIRAMRLAAASYERYELQRYRIRKVKGETAVRVEPYDSGDVGW